MKKKIFLITGSEGFIGSHLINFLKKKNYIIYGSYYKKKRLSKVRGVTYYKCDVRNSAHVEYLLKKTKPDIIFHLAAKSHPNFSLKKPLETIMTNTIGTANILEYLRILKFKSKLIIACSSAQYGVRKINELPMKEDQAYKPEHIYGLSKVFQDNLATQYFKMFNIKTLRALIFNTSGPGKKNDVFYDLCKQFSSQQNKKKIQIKVGNLNNYRDFMHVDDVVRALYTISLKGQIGDNYNISSERLIRVSKIIDIFLELAGNKKLFLIKKNFLYRKFDEKYIGGDNSKLKKIGWLPVKNIKDIVLDMLNFNSKKK